VIGIHSDFLTPNLQRDGTAIEKREVSCCILTKDRPAACAGSPLLGKATIHAVLDDPCFFAGKAAAGNINVMPELATNNACTKHAATAAAAAAATALG
jgi:hypothetical protein